MRWRLVGRTAAPRRRTLAARAGSWPDPSGDTRHEAGTARRYAGTNRCAGRTARGWSMSVLDEILDGVAADLAVRMDQVPLEDLKAQAERQAPALDPMPAFRAEGVS